MEELLRYDPRNRLTAYTKGNVTTPFQYDNAGNLLADDKALYSYDAFNRTVRAETFDGHIQLNRYDAEGLRYEMEENGRLVRFIFNQDREAVTEENAGGLNRLIRGTELIARSSDSARTYYHYASIVLLDQKYAETCTYYLPVLEYVDCLTKGSILTKDHSIIIEAEIDPSKMREHSIAYIASVGNLHTIVRLDIVESFLQRGAKGLSLNEVKTVHEEE